MPRIQRPAPLFVVTVIAAVAATWITWHKVVRHEVIAENFGVVDPERVFRSAQLTPRMLRDVIATHDIRTIIALNGDDRESAREADVARALGVQRYTYNLIGDGTGDPRAYADVVRLMSDPANQPVLVHCAAGAQRTTTAALLYRHFVHGEAFADTYPEMFRYDHEPDEWILLAYLTDHLDEIRARYEADGPVLDFDCADPSAAPAPAQ